MLPSLEPGSTHFCTEQLKPCTVFLNFFFNEFYQEIWKEIHSVLKNGVNEQTPSYYLINCKGGSLTDIRGFFDSPSIRLFVDFFLQVFRLVFSPKYSHS